MEELRISQAGVAVVLEDRCASGESLNMQNQMTRILDFLSLGTNFSQLSFAYTLLFIMVGDKNTTELCGGERRSCQHLFSPPIMWPQVFPLAGKSLHSLTHLANSQ